MLIMMVTKCRIENLAFVLRFGAGKDKAIKKLPTLTPLFKPPAPATRAIKFQKTQHSSVSSREDDRATKCWCFTLLSVLIILKARNSSI